MSDAAAKRAARAIDALRRGWPVRFADVRGSLTLVAIETGGGAESCDVAGLLLSSARAATLKLANQFSAADVQLPVRIAAPPELDATLALAIADPSLPGGRVGRAPNGNAVLDAIEVDAVSVADPAQRVRVPLAWAWADVEQPNGDFRVVNALRRDSRTWAVDGHRIPGNRAALFVSSEPFGFAGGTELHVKLVTRSPYAQHVLGRVRLRPATVSDALVSRLPPASSNWYICGPFPVSGGAQGYAGPFGPEAGLDVDQRFGEPKRGEFAWRHAPGVLEATAVRLAEGVDAEFVAREIHAAAPGTIDVSLGSDDGIQVFVNGAMVHERRIERSVGPDQERVTVPLVAGKNSLVCKVVEANGRPAVKLSDNPLKATGEKSEIERYLRIFGTEGQAEIGLKV